MLELEEQAIAAGARERRRERHRVALGVHVQEREVALAQRDQVAARAEVGLSPDGLRRRG